MPTFEERMRKNLGNRLQVTAGVSQARTAERQQQQQQDTQTQAQEAQLPTPQQRKPSITNEQIQQQVGTFGAPGKLSAPEQEQEPTIRPADTEKGVIDRITEGVKEKLPEQVVETGEQFVEQVEEGLLGTREEFRQVRGREPETIKEQIVTSGLLRNPLLEFVTRSPETSASFLEEELKSRGVDEDRAITVAQNLKESKQGPLGLIKRQRTKKDLNLSDEEESALLERRMKEGLGQFLEAVDFATFGAAKPVREASEEVVTQIAKTKSARKIADTLKESLGFSDEAAQGAADALKVSEDPKAIKKALRNTTESLNRASNALTRSQARQIAEQGGITDEVAQTFSKFKDEATKVDQAVSNVLERTKQAEQRLGKFFDDEIIRKLNVSQTTDDFVSAIDDVEYEQIVQQTGFTPEAVQQLEQTKEINGVPAEEVKSFTKFIREAQQEDRKLADATVELGRRLGIQADSTNELKQIAKKADNAADTLTEGAKRKPSPRPERVLGREQPRQVTQREDVAMRQRFRQQAKGSREQLRKTQLRRARIKSAQKEFNLSDAEMRSVRELGDIRTMPDKEFDDYMQRIRKRAEEIQRTQELKAQVRGTIWERELQNTENMRRAMNLPPISQMDNDQLVEFDTILSQYKQGDEFLSPRKIEVVDKTDFSGSRTRREALEIFAKKTGASAEDIQNVKINEIDSFAFDAALARRGVFQKYMVNEATSKQIQTDVRYTQFENQLNDVISRARQSRKRGIIDRIVPMDKTIWNYLEADAATKAKMRPDMTDEEFEAAEFIRKSFEDARDYLVQHQALEKYRSNYITHVRRNVLEALREDIGEEGFFKGLKNTFKEIFSQYEQEQAVFNILDEETDQVLPLEKFFRFSMQRSGNYKPSKNVAKAVSQYFFAFERKKGLDDIIPSIDVVANSLTPKTYTPNGKQADESIRKFYKKWVNARKGRRPHALVQPGGKLDWGARSLIAFTRLLDLGGNIAIQVAAPFGEAAANYIAFGAKPIIKGRARRAAIGSKTMLDRLTKMMTLGKKRLNMSKGQRIMKKYEGFVGRTPWDGIREASKTTDQKFMEGLFAGYQQAHVNANKTLVLGTLTKDEWASETLDPKRLSALKQQANRWRPMNDTKSIAGATTEGEIGRQYKSWAVPIMWSTSQNLKELSQRILREPVKDTLQSAAFQESLRQSIIAAIGGLTVHNIVKDDEEEQSFVDEIITKAGRDALSSIGALNPGTWLSVPRTIQFIGDLGKALSSIVLLEEYKTKEGLKGVGKLEDMFTPQAVEQFLPEEGRGGSVSAGGGGEIKGDADVFKQLNQEAQTGEVRSDEEVFRELEKEGAGLSDDQVDWGSL